MGADKRNHLFTPGLSLSWCAKTRVARKQRPGRRPRVARTFLIVERTSSASFFLGEPIWRARAVLRSKVDGCVQQTRDVILRMVGQPD